MLNATVALPEFSNTDAVVANTIGGGGLTVTLTVAVLETKDPVPVVP